jgi:superfamily II DNA helicase RecQ
VSAAPTPFSVVAAALADDPRQPLVLPSPAPSEDAFLWRLIARCLHVLRIADGAPHAPSPADRAVQLRMVIRALGPASAWRLHPELRARLPACLDAFNLAEGSGAVRALPFSFAGEDGRLCDARPELRRVQRPVPADVPLLACTDHTAYASAAQKQAVHAALTAPPGGVLLATLPTGAGKSLVTQLLALEPMRRGQPRLVVCVVPTVALAIDQHRAALPLFERMGASHRVAYLAGDDQDAASRLDLIDRVRRGAISLLFAAPERLVRGPLADAILACGREQGLAALVVDEAHLVAGWGGRFRPAFQQVKEQRGRLLEVTPDAFPTVLLSATVTPQTAGTLRDLFAPNQTPFLRVDARTLRAEPDWVAHRFEDRDERLREAVHVLRHLPRPAIAYTTSVEDAENLYEALRAGPLGFGRIALFTGETRGDQRVRIVDEWRANELDIVVATSAFGLGVDKPDVRAIVHATMPEGLDRFYQEAGRGGRDGYATLSCVLWTSDDRDLARRNAFINVITTNKALARWSAMSNGKDPEHGEVRTLDLWSRPAYAGSRAEERRSEGTVGWNLATLLLFERAGVLRVTAIDTKRDMADIVWAWRDDRTALEQAVDRQRLEEQEQNAESLATMRLALEASRRKCMAERLGELYSVPSSAPCGRCAACRTARKEADLTALPEPSTPAWNAVASGLPSPDRRLRGALGTSATALVLYPTRWAEVSAGRERLGALLARLGCSLAVGPAGMLPALAAGMRRLPSAPGLLISREEAADAGWRLQRVTVAAVLQPGDGPDVLEDALAAGQDRSPDTPLVLALPLELSFPEHGGRPAAHEVPTPCRLEAESLAQELGI